MDIAFEIIKISPRIEENIDYSTLVFKINLIKNVNSDNSNDYWIMLRTLIEGGAQKILIDFKNTEYIDSSGIGVLIKAAKLIKANKGEIAISNVSNELKEIFKVINLHNLINIYNTDVEAVNSFRYISA